MTTEPLDRGEVDRGEFDRGEVDREQVDREQVDRDTDGPPRDPLDKIDQTSQPPDQPTGAEPPD